MSNPLKTHENSSFLCNACRELDNKALCTHCRPMMMETKLLQIDQLKTHTSHVNRPFPRYFVPLFQNESLSKTIHMIMCFNYGFIFMQINSSSYERFFEDSF